eukprot:TRINITY_DN9588_c0_g2_i5.p2 TRINITY_DN9588_c0_g2~~TRINITY_DN9588_c0_g2_i5.p2  ORF type:complete len:371 (-),score=61.82 TRINITY_DN9588_c0_g2_i5:254-1366(-)
MEIQQNKAMLETAKLDTPSNLSYIMELQRRQVPNLPSMGIKRKDGDIFKKPPPKKFKPDTRNEFNVNDIPEQKNTPQIVHTQLNNNKNSDNHNQEINTVNQLNQEKAEHGQKVKEGIVFQQQEEDEDIYNDTFGHQVGNQQNDSGNFLNLYGKQDEGVQNLGSDQQQVQQVSAEKQQPSLFLPRQQQQYQTQYQQQQLQVNVQEGSFENQQLQTAQDKILHQQKQQGNVQKKVQFGLLTTLNEWKTSNPDKAYTVRHQQPYNNKNGGSHNNKQQLVNKPGPPPNDRGVVSLMPIQPPPQNFAAQQNGVAFQGGRPNKQGGGQGAPQHGKKGGRKNRKRGGQGGHKQNQQGDKKGYGKGFQKFQRHRNKKN